MLSSDTHVLTPLSPLLSPDCEMRDALDRERVRADTAEARVAELEGNLCDALNSAREWKVESITARCGLNKLKATFKNNRKKLASVREELKDLRRSQSARNVRRLERDNARLSAILKSSEIDPVTDSMTALRKEIFRLKGVISRQEETIAELEAANTRLSSTNATHSKARFGTRSEKNGKGKSSSTGIRGQQTGKPGHGRSPRLHLERKIETHNPPDNDRLCPCCGAPYVQNGSHESEFVEIKVKTHVRKVRRPRWRKTCDCALAPQEVTAPPVPRLFSHTAYGISFWSCFLLESYACYRPINRVAAWMRDHGLAVSAGTLADSIGRMTPLFEPLSQAILEDLKTAGTLHGDETSWRVQALKKNRGTSRAWLWCAGAQHAVWFHVDKRRNTEAALKLFDGVAPKTVLVCDAYSAYKKLARIRSNYLTLAWCWAHIRRKFIQAAAGNDAFALWEKRWLDRIGRLYRLNRFRLKHYNPAVGMKEQSKTFCTAQRQLKSAVNRVFDLAEKELKGPAGSDRRRKALTSLIEHRSGLSVFVNRPQTPMDNNFAECALRGPVIGRKLSFGSDSEKGAAFSAMMYGVFATLRMNGINIKKWLTAWLTACAENGGRPPDDLTPWLPWSMTEERRLSFGNSP